MNDNQIRLAWFNKSKELDKVVKNRITKSYLEMVRGPYDFLNIELASRIRGLNFDDYLFLVLTEKGDARKYVSRLERCTFIFSATSI